MPPALQASHLKKAYGQRTAVTDVSLHVNAGEVLGLLGPNGAGKSTTIAMLCGLTPADAGQVAVGGLSLAQDAMACKHRIGLVPQELALFEDLAAQSNVELFAALYGMSRATARERAAQVLAQVGLADRARDKPAAFSGGMKRRLNIACALVHDPDVLLLDEPTAGVDPQSRNAIFGTLLALKSAGKALVYTTHYMEEVERLADRVVIIDHGRVVAEGSLPELYRRLPAAQKLQLELEDPRDGKAHSATGTATDAATDAATHAPAFVLTSASTSPSTSASTSTSTDARVRATLQALPGVRSVSGQSGRWTLGVDDLAQGSASVLQGLASAGLVLRHVSSGRANLEDVFLGLTGRQLRD